MPKKNNKPISIDINLVPKDPFFKTPAGRVMKWALSIGRYIVIFTELIVIVSFVSRFSLDRRITDLNNSIFQQRTIIESYGSLEDTIRTAQKKVEALQQVNDQVAIVDIFPELSRIMPNGVTLQSLVIKDDRITLTGNTISQDALNTLLGNIQISPLFIEVSVPQIATDSDEELGIVFSLTSKIRTEFL